MKYFVTRHHGGLYLLNKMHYCDTSKGIDAKWESISHYDTKAAALNAGNAMPDIEGQCLDCIEAFAPIEQIHAFKRG